MQDPVAIAIVESSIQYRKKLEGLINSSEGLHCVCTCSSGAEVNGQMTRTAPNVVVIEVMLEDQSGIECMQRLKRGLPDTQFLLLTPTMDGEQIFALLRAGAGGVLLKQTPLDQIIAAIRELNEGGAPMSPSIARGIVQQIRKRTAERSEVERLSPRQREILKLLAQGRVGKEIADQMHLSVETVRSYTKLIYQKLQVRSRTEAVIKYYG